MDTDRLRAFAFPLAALLGAATLGSPVVTHAQTLVWEDNFDGPAIDGNKWTYDVGDGCQFGICGWGNGELQYYTSRAENARIEDGHLLIEARRETFEGHAFTSARLKTEGRMHFRYGTLEARIKIPRMGNGLWPAYWMLGTVGVWPARGEIDMMEAGSAAAIAAGLTNRRVGAAVHWDYNGSRADYGRDYDSSTDLTDDFHVYRLNWDPQFIRVSIDGQQYFEFAISDIEGASLQEFHNQQFLLLNLAVGGTYTGIFNAEGITAPLPGRMEVDYIRLYQDAPDSQLYLGSAAAEQPGHFGVYSEQAGLVRLAVAGLDGDAGEPAAPVLEQDRRASQRQVLGRQLVGFLRHAAQGHHLLAREGVAELDDPVFHLGHRPGVGDERAGRAVEGRHRRNGVRR